MDYNMFDKLFDDKFYVLDTIKRFQGRHMNVPETVPHHTCWVVHYAHEIAVKLGYSVEDLYRVMLCAQYHDFEETITYDVNFNLKYNKYNGSEIREAIDEYVQSVVSHTNIGRCLEVQQIMCLRPKIKAIVKLADWLSLMKTVLFELKTGNESVRDMMKIAITKVEELLDKSADCFDEAFIKDFNVVLLMLQEIKI